MLNKILLFLEILVLITCTWSTSKTDLKESLVVKFKTQIEKKLKTFPAAISTPKLNLKHFLIYNSPNMFKHYILTNLTSKALLEIYFYYQNLDSTIELEKKIFTTKYLLRTQKKIYCRFRKSK